MSDRTYVCLQCKTSRRAAAAYGQPHGFRCVECSEGLTELPWERRIPTKADEEGWRELRVFLAEQNEGRVPPRMAQKQMPEGLHSLFQLPARKRKRRNETI